MAGLRVFTDLSLIAATVARVRDLAGPERARLSAKAVVVKGSDAREEERRLRAELEEAKRAGGAKQEELMAVRKNLLDNTNKLQMLEEKVNLKAMQEEQYV